MNRVVIGILAHVDSGKTTLSEGMLYSAGEIRKIGRVDHGDAFLDSHEIERDKGITIFSKQAVMRFRDTEFTLLDTPGHVDFSTEMERTLSDIHGTRKTEDRMPKNEMEPVSEIQGKAKKTKQKANPIIK